MKISKIAFPLLLTAMALVAAPAFSADETLQFDNLGGVKTWKSGGDATVFIKSKSDQWYRADMQETCMKLDTSKGVNFITELDPVANVKVSKVIVARHICLVTSLKKVDSPDAK